MILLLFAGGIVLLSDTATGLQNQLNVLSKSAETQTSQQIYKNQFTIVFRNGGHLAGRERCEKKWWTHKYLGLFFRTRLSFLTIFKEN